MDYNININKICRVCLEENAVTSIFHTEFAMIPAEMLMLCAKVRVSLQSIPLPFNWIHCTLSCFPWNAGLQK